MDCQLQRGRDRAGLLVRDSAEERAGGNGVLTDLREHVLGRRCFDLLAQGVHCDDVAMRSAGRARRRPTDTAGTVLRLLRASPERAAL